MPGLGFILEPLGSVQEGGGGSLPPTKIRLDHSPADILAAWLIAEGYGTRPSANGLWPIYVNFMPGGNNEAICVYDTVGTNDGRSHRDGELIEHPGIQIRFRANDHRTGYYKADTIAKEGLDTINQAPAVINSSNYLIQNAKRTGNINSLGEDPATRKRIFTVNALLTVSQVT